MIRINALIVILVFVLGFEQSYSSEKDFQVLMPDKKIGRTSKVLANRVMVRFKRESIQSTNAESILKVFDKSATVNNSLLKPSEAVTYNKNLKSKILSKPNQDINRIIQAEEPLLRTYTINYTEDRTPEDYCKELLKYIPEIEIAEPVYIPELLQFYPNDPMVISGAQTMLYTCKLFEAWEIEQGDTNVIIGISDTGVEQSHEDLSNSLAHNWNDPVNGIDDDGNGYIDDFAGYDITGQNQPPDNTYNGSDDHGTNVAGIAAATVNNEIGMAGTAYKCRIFPIKMAIGDTPVVPYESVIYAANRGVKVLNCSWGIVKPFSSIDQSVFDFAVAHDVAVIAAGGNDNGSLDNMYPAAYDGVLAVGEVDQSDVFSGNNIGAYIDILAPGRNWYPTNNNGYGNGSGSSYSAPVVSGIVALIRAKYPALTALQSLELARQSVDDVTGKNGNIFWKDILPGRINAYKAVTTEPFSIPSIRPKKVSLKSTNGFESTRFGVADTILLSIDAFNFLGEANNLKFELSAVWDETASIQVIDSLVEISKVESESQVRIEEYKFVIKKENREKMFFRCDILGENNYRDFFLIEFVPSPIVTTFKNNAIAFSVSDRGTIGFGGSKDNIQGIGFVYRDKGNQIWKSCFVASDSNKKTVSSLLWDRNTFDRNDFSTIKSFVPDSHNIGIFNDDNAFSLDKLGIEVRQEFIIPNGYHTIAKVNIEITNSGDKDIVDFTSGYYFDWDINNSDSNSVELLPEAVSTGLDEKQASAEMIFSSDASFPVFGNGVISYDSAAVVQLAGFNGSNDRIYDEDKRAVIMNGGTDIQDFGIFDAMIFSGVKYFGNFAPGEKRKYSICFGGAENREEFIQKMKIALDSTYTPINELSNKNFSVNIFPQPAGDYLYFQVESYKDTQLNISIIDLLGRELFAAKRELKDFGNLSMPIDLLKFETGTYILKVVSGNNYQAFPIIVIK